jgi:hypothetical protein
MVAPRSGRIFWLPRRKFRRDEADFSDSADRSPGRFSPSRQGSIFLLFALRRLCGGPEPARAAVKKKSRPAKMGCNAARIDQIDPKNPLHPEETSVSVARRCSAFFSPFRVLRETPESVWPEIFGQSGQSKRGPVQRPSGYELRLSVPDSSITLACGFLETRTVHHGDVSARVRDQARFL